MNLTSILKLLGECPLVVSVQAPEGSPLRDDSTLVRLALASANEGVRLLRAEGPSSLQAIARSTGLPVMGLIKRTYEGSPVYITPTLAEVEEVLSDDRIVEILHGEGVEIARRTVAKYREAMKIASSVQRRREKMLERRSNRA